MNDKLKLWLIYSASAIYLALCIYFAVFKNSYIPALIPIGLVMVWIMLNNIDAIFYMIVFLTPLSIEMSDTEFGVGISLPSEPLLIVILLFFIFRVLYDNPYNISLLKKPLTWAVLFSLFWMLVTCFTSEYPIVSIKYLIARLWFVVPCYFFAFHLFLNPQNIRRVFYLYGSAVALTVIYTLVNHAVNGFTQQSGHWVMRPFYNDHTQYGAILSMVIPIFGGLFFSKSISKWMRFTSLALTGFFMIAIIFSYCRASWIALVVSLGFMSIVLLKIKFRYIFIAFCFLAGMFLSFQDEILYRMQKNDQDSSTNFAEHLQSIYNISSDASNLERINRWNSAIKMFKERPVFGWGPGTYQFCYAPFQSSQDRTIISTNAGDGGNAHSEYIGPLSEQGVLGSLSFIFITIISIYLGYKIYRKTDNREIKITSLTVTMALVAYYVNGVLNNFLDTDKASVPFWTFLAILVALDYCNNKSSSIKTQKTL